MSRRELREWIFQTLFRMEFHNKEEYEKQLELLFETEEMSDEDKTYAKNKILDIGEHIEEIDAAINEVAKGWKTSRMAKVDLTIIRLAVYEIRYEEEIPTKVAINEAVEMAKKYGTDTSSSFVNGILAKIA
ncbi:transcription antitermination factor NusB [Roseburia hominis]|uniref:transcription antitermination factor NusB n=1 Tax=Roseburia hominis TaxID=301301 RepID=UPI001F3BD61C|nr:transcription antitermination factor NusB [Roseburia hominis]